MLITETDECLGGWGLINCEDLTDDPAQEDMDVILLLSQKAFYVAQYNDEIDQVTSYQEILLDDLTMIEVGVATLSSKWRPMCIRIHYASDTDHGYFHTFCATHTRLFNNVVVIIRNEEEARESLRAISESFLAASKLRNRDLTIVENKIERKTSKSHPNIIDIACQAQEQVESSLPHPTISRDNSSHSLRTVTVSPSMHRKNYISPKGSPLPAHHTGGAQPPSKLSNIGRAVADMIPLSKLQLNNFKMKMTKMPDKIRSASSQKDAIDGGGCEIVKHDEATDEIYATNVAQLCAANVAHNASEEFRTRETRLFQAGLLNINQELMSRSVSTLNSPEFEVSIQGPDNLVLLKSCGILWVGAQQVIAALHRCGVGQCSVDRGAGTAPKGDEKNNSNKVSFKPDGIASKKKELLNMLSKSLDIDETERLKKREQFMKLSDDPDKKREEIVNISTNIKSLNSSEDLIDFKTIGSIDDHSISNNHRSELESTAEVENNPLHVVDDIPYDDKPAVGPPTGRPAVRRPTIMLDDKEVTAQPPPPLERRISLLKISYSEGALVNSFQTGESALNFDPDDLDSLDPDAVDAHGSAFSKLRVKMANLAIPSMQQPVAQQKQLQQAVRNNAMKSRLRFKECKTKILLL